MRMSRNEKVGNLVIITVNQINIADSIQNYKKILFRIIILNFQFTSWWWDDLYI